MQDQKESIEEKEYRNPNVQGQKLEYDFRGFSVDSNLEFDMPLRHHILNYELRNIFILEKLMDHHHRHEWTKGL